MKLLIDECLSQKLATLARDRGHPESSHVRWIGRAGAENGDLINRVIEVTIEDSSDVEIVVVRYALPQSQE
ncbi:MAG: DUF5615 family PIN-like protein [Stellaceae bacterium]